MENNITVIPQLGMINCDFEAAHKYIQSRVDEYKGILFTEDTKTDAKKTVAQLHKEKKEFQDRIKEVKAEYMKPFDDFYGKAMSLCQMFDEPISYINEQIDAFEQSRIEEKKKKIEEMYKEFIGDLAIADIIPLSKIYNPRWDNATFTLTQIAEEMMSKRDVVINGATVIEAMNTDVKDKAMDILIESMDLSKAMLFITEHEKQKAEILANEKARLIEEAKVEAKAEARAEIEAEVIQNMIPDFDGTADLYEYRCSLTKDAKEKLEMYMDSVGIEWEIING